MAITIIKGGKDEFLGHCKWCGCDFRYTDDDVMKTVDEVACPQKGCGRALKHYGENGTSLAPSFDPSFGWYNQAHGNAAASLQMLDAHGSQREDLKGK